MVKLSKTVIIINYNTYGDYRWDIQATFYIWLSEYALKIIAQQKVKGVGYNAHLSGIF